MLKIGCHLSSSKGYAAMLEQAFSIDASTFQFFTRNPRGSSIKGIDLEDIKEFNDIAARENIRVVGHAPYTLNPASPDKRVLDFAYLTMKEDISRMELIPYNFYNIHPGCHLNTGAEEGIKRVVDLLNDIITKETTTTVLIETMSGKGTEIGRTFQEIKMILDGVRFRDKVGVCLDTCHVYDGGYDIKNDLEDVFDEFDKIIGLDSLHAVHINDSKNPFNSHKDRHEKIGEGFLGMETFVNVINNGRLKGRLFVLETPNGIDGYAHEISMLRGQYINI